MSAFVDFKDLTAAKDALFNKYYSSKAPFTIRGRVVQGDLTFLSKVRQLKTTELLALLGLSYQHGDLGLKLRKKSNGTSSYLLQYAKVVSVHKIIGSLEYGVLNQGMLSKHEPGISLLVCSDKANFKIGLKSNPLIMNMSLTGGYKQLSAGVDWKFALNSQRYTEHAIAIRWLRDKSTLIAKHNSNELSFGTFEFSYYLQLTNALELASLITSNWADKQTDIKIGMQYEFDRSSLFKCRIDSNGKVGFAYKMRINPNFEAIIGAEADTKEIATNRLNDYGVGLTVNFNY